MFLIGLPTVLFVLNDVGLIIIITSFFYCVSRYRISRVSIVYGRKWLWGLRQRLVDQFKTHRGRPYSLPLCIVDSPAPSLPGCPEKQLILMEISLPADFLGSLLSTAYDDHSHISHRETLISLLDLYCYNEELGPFFFTWSMIFHTYLTSGFVVSAINESHQHASHQPVLVVGPFFAGTWSFDGC